MIQYREIADSGFSVVFQRRIQEDSFQDRVFEKVLLRNRYKRPLHKKAMVLLSLGFSARETAKILKMSKGTICGLRRDLLKVQDIKCGCGGAPGHRGWCWWRFAKSPARVLLIKRLHQCRREANERGVKARGER